SRASWKTRVEHLLVFATIGNMEDNRVKSTIFGLGIGNLL
ncbi:hypothetical protein AVEN_114401-2-1, partial [Araneus ventricosus]